MLKDFSKDWLFRSTLTSLSAWLLCGSISLAEGPSYSRALRDLPSGTILSKSNIKQVFADQPHPKGAISGCSILYGCKIYAPLHKNDPVTDAEVCAGRWSTVAEPKDDDPAWIKAEKNAQIALKADDLDRAMRSCDEAIAELDKLGQRKERITDFTEMSHLLIPYTEVDLATWRSQRHTHGNLNDRAQSMVEGAKKELAQSQKLLSAMKKLLPSDNFYLVSQEQDVEHKEDDLKKSVHINNMAKSLSKTDVSNR